MFLIKTQIKLNNSSGRPQPSSLMVNQTFDIFSPRNTGDFFQRARKKTSGGWRLNWKLKSHG